MSKSIAFVLMIGVVVAGGPSLADDVSERSWIRLQGGQEVLVVGAVERVDGLVLYRTATGVLASIPEAQVLGVEPAVFSEASIEADRDAGHRQATPEAAVFTNDDLPTEPLPWQASFERAQGASTGLEDSDLESADLPLSYDTYRDRNGNDEAWWRERAAAIDAERDEAREEYEIWSERYRSLSDLVAIECVGRRRRFKAYLPAVCADYVRLQRDANERAADARAWLDDVDAERRNLSDEARRAAALPGWLR